MKLKKILAGVLAGVMMLSLAACGGSKDGNATSGSEKSSSKEKLTIWAWDESYNIKAANQAKEIYAKKNPDLEVDVVTMARKDIVAKLNTSLSAGSYDGLPDIVLIEDYQIPGYLNAYQDEFADLSEFAKQEDFAEYKTGMNTVDGKVYGVPFDSGVAATFYRLDLVEEAGYTKADMEDLTWDKYIEIGKAIKEKTGVSLLTLDPNDIGQIRMMLQSAGSWYTDAEGKVDVANNQALKDSINTYQKLMQADIIKIVSDWEQFVGAFNNGDVASVVTGCWISPSVTSAEDQSGKWAVAAMPRMAENANSVNASSIGGAGWYVLQNAGNPEVAKDFLKETFSSSVELMNQLAADINLVASLKAASTAENYNKGIEFYGGQEVFKDLSTWSEKVPAVNYGDNTYVVEDMMTEAVQAILNGADMDATLADYQTQIEASVNK